MRHHVHFSGKARKCNSFDKRLTSTEWAAFAVPVATITVIGSWAALMVCFPTSVVQEDKVSRIEEKLDEIQVLINSKGSSMIASQDSAAAPHMSPPRLLCAARPLPAGEGGGYMLPDSPPGLLDPEPPSWPRDALALE